MDQALAVRLGKGTAEARQDSSRKRNVALSRWLNEEYRGRNAEHRDSGSHFPPVGSKVMTYQMLSPRHGAGCLNTLGFRLGPHLFQKLRVGENLEVVSQWIRKRGTKAECGRQVENLKG